jgi:UDP-2,3-diacylglucosamine pyrophosphatase LpxH
MTRYGPLIFAASLLALSGQPLLAQQDQAAIATIPFVAPPAGPRYRVFISDTHMGMGRRADGNWFATEDFRWPKALAAFLAKVSADGNDNVDLVMVGDFLEMWQPPEGMCKGLTADLGCTLDEMAQLAELIVKGHTDEFRELRAFAERGQNRFHVIPGNHDSTLSYEKVWQPVGNALNAANGRINLVTSGLWSTPDRKIVVEHGHQIGLDVNRYETWPHVVNTIGGVHYVIRPWGELFVQRLFNEQEEAYPLIDNLSPETAGARYRAADRGVWGSAVDIARFVMFNLIETSITQKSAVLGPEASKRREWDIEIARGLGANLFLNALPANDPLRDQVLKSDEAASLIKKELADLAKNSQRLPDAEVLHLCDLIADANNKPDCADPTLGSAIGNALIPKEKIMERHLRTRRAQFKEMQAFIYGHTHQFEKPWTVTPDVSITVANSGAFQRLINEQGFLKRLNGMSPQEGLRKLELDKLPPCYTAILVPHTTGAPSLNVRAWYMPNDAQGIFIEPDDPRCQ